MVKLAVTSSTSGAAVNTTGALSTSAGVAPAATATLSVTTLPNLAKTFDPVNIIAGGTSTLTLTVNNANDSAMTLTALFTDTYPTGMTNVSPADTTGTTCAGVTATAGDNKFTIANGTSIASGSCVVKVKVTSSTPGPAVNTTGSMTTSAGVGAPATATLTVSAIPTLAKSFTPATILKGGTSTLTVTIGNSNAFAITLSGVFTDNYPAGLANVSPIDTTGTTCTGITANAGAGNFTIASGTSIPVGGCVVSVKVTSSTPGAAVNTTGTLSTSAGVAQPASATLMVLDLPTLAKSFNPTTIIPGGTSTMTVTIGNANRDAVTLSAPFTDTYPAGLTNTNPAVTTGTTCLGVTAGNGAGSFTIASGTSIPSGGCVVVLAVTSSTSGPAVNTTGALSTSAGTAPAATATLTVTTLPTLAKTFDPATIIAGAASTLTVTINNANASAITLTALFTDTYPAGLTNVSPADTTGTTCLGVTATAGDNKFTIANGTSIPQGSCVVKVKVTSSTSGPAVNTTGSLTTSAGVGTPATSTLTVAAPPTLAKSFLPTTIAKGGTSTLTVTIANPNAFAITLSGDFEDTYPSGMVNTSPVVSTGTTCAGVTAEPGGGHFTIAGGSSIPASSSCVVKMTVVGNAAGALVNDTGTISTSAGIGAKATATLTVLAPPAIAKAFSPTTIALNGSGTLVSTLTFTITNPNTSDALTGVGFTDSFPAGVVVAATPNVQVAGCGAGAFNPVVAAGAGSVTFAGATVANQIPCVVSVDVRGTSSGTKDNTSGAVTSTNGGTGNVAQATLTVLSVPTVTKTFDPTTITLDNGTTTLTVLLRNLNGIPITLTDVFTDTFPAGMTIVTPVNSSGDCANVTAVAGASSFSIASGTVIPVPGCTVVLKVTSTAVGTATNVTSSLYTSAGIGAPGTAILTVLAVPTVAKSFDPQTIVAGDTSRLRVTVGNANASAYTLTSDFIDNLPPGMTIASPLDTGGTTCAGLNAVAGATSFAIASGTTVGAGGCVVQVNVTSSTPGDSVNTIAVDALQTTIGSNEFPAEATLTVILAGAPIPTLGEFGLIAMMLMLAGVAGVCARRVRR